MPATEEMRSIFEVRLSGFPNKANDLLAEIGVMNGETDKLQWSVLYNLTTGDGQIFVNRKIDNITYFHLYMKK